MLILVKRAWVEVSEGPASLIERGKDLAGVTQMMAVGTNAKHAQCANGFQYQN